MTGEPHIAEPLRCQKCGAPVPLLGATSFECPHCRATVKVSKSYQELFETNRLEADARRELQTHYAHVSRVPSRRFDTLALALVILGPAIAARLRHCGRG